MKDSQLRNVAPPIPTLSNPPACRSNGLQTFSSGLVFLVFFSSVLDHPFHIYWKWEQNKWFMLSWYLPSKDLKRLLLLLLSPVGSLHNGSFSASLISNYLIHWLATFDLQPFPSPLSTWIGSKGKHRQFGHTRGWKSAAWSNVTSCKQQPMAAKDFRPMI